MTTSKSFNRKLIKEQSAFVLLDSVIAFLRKHKISEVVIKQHLRHLMNGQGFTPAQGRFQKLIITYEDMGIIVATWYGNPKFLDKLGQPVPLSPTFGRYSIANLVRASRVRTTYRNAMELLRLSTSIRTDLLGNLLPTNRVFVLPGIEVPRAALVIQRYLDTSRRNSAAATDSRVMFLDRNCYVPELNVRDFSAIMRDVKDQSSAFMDSVDGQIEGRRLKKSNGKGKGEIGLFVFAWANSGKSKVSRMTSTKKTRLTDQID